MNFKKTNIAILTAAICSATPFLAENAHAQAGSTDGAQNVRKDSTMLPEVTVTTKADMPGELPPAYAGGQVAKGGRVGLLGNKDVMDTPFSMTTYTQQLIQDQQAKTLADVVANDPSVRNTNPRGGRFDQFTIRGFEMLNSEVTWNGLAGLIPTYTVPAEMIERVEIVKGPNALLNGMSTGGAVGGAINVVPKRAGDTPLTEFTASYASDGQLGGHLDLGRRFGTDNQFGVRLNTLYANGDTSFSDQAIQRNLVALGLDFRGEKLRLSTDIYHQEHRGTAPLERLLVNPNVAMPDANRVERNFAPKWTTADTRDDSIALRGEYDITPDTMAYAAVGARRGKYDFIRFNPTLTNAAGTITSRARRFTRDEDILSGETGIRTQLTTGPVKHAISFGASATKIEFGNADARTGNLTSNLYQPVDLARPAIASVPTSPPRTGDTKLVSFALSDTLSFAEDRVQLTLGARNQRVVIRAFAPNGGPATSEYDESAITPALALLLKPTDNISLYGNYIEALSQGETAPATADNAGQIFKPTKTKQVEAGVKVDFGKISTTLSVFRIEQPNGFTDPASNVFAMDGKQRNSGAELSIFGEPVRGFRVLGGVMLLDGELTRTLNGTHDGKTAPAVAKLNLSLGAELDMPFLPGLTLTARTLYSGEQYLDQANTQKIPGWTKWDVGARYAFKAGKTPVTVRASIDNVFDKKYWASTSGSGLTYGTPRTVYVSTTIAF